MFILFFLYLLSFCEILRNSSLNKVTHLLVSYYENYSKMSQHKLDANEQFRLVKFQNQINKKPGFC